MPAYPVTYPAQKEQADTDEDKKRFRMLLKKTKGNTGVADKRQMKDTRQNGVTRTGLKQRERQPLGGLVGE